MILNIKGVQVKINQVRHINYCIGATFEWPNGKKTYGEFRNIGEVVNSVLKNKEN